MGAVAHCPAVHGPGRSGQLDLHAIPNYIRGADFDSPGAKQSYCPCTHVPVFRPRTAWASRKCRKIAVRPTTTVIGIQPLNRNQLIELLASTSSSDD